MLAYLILEDDGMYGLQKKGKRVYQKRLQTTRRNIRTRYRYECLLLARYD